MAVEHDITFWPGLAVAVAAMAVNASGVLALHRHSTWAERNNLVFAAFAVGVLGVVAIFHLIPEAREAAPASWHFTLVGIAVMAAASFFVASCPSPTAPRTAPPPDAPAGAAAALHHVGYVPVIGIGFHSFIDGIAYATTFHVSIESGLLTALGLLLHEIPEGIIAYTLLLSAGRTAKTAMIGALALTAATTPLGFLASYPFIGALDEIALANLLAATAGALIYVAGVHLIPRLVREGELHHTGMIGLGATTAALAIHFAH